MRTMELLYYKHRKNFKTYKINKDIISFYELSIVFKGQLKYKINNQLIVLNENEMIFIPPNSLRERLSSNEQSDYVSFNFLSNVYINLPNKIEHADRWLISALIHCCDNIFTQLNSDSYPQITHLLNCIIENATFSTANKDVPLLVSNIKRFLHNNLSKNLSLSDVGNLFHYSPVYCNILFKKYMNLPIISYFLQLKIEEAKKMLIENELPLKKIARSLGFDDYNYFARIFKKHTKTTPLKYKKDFLY